MKSSAHPVVFICDEDLTLAELVAMISSGIVSIKGIYVPPRNDTSTVIRIEHPSKGVGT